VNNIELGKRIKQLRLGQGFTLKDIESQVGVSATHVSEIERGKTSPTIGALAKIALALQVNPSFLLDFPVGEDVSLTHAGDRDRLVGSRNGAEWEVLTRETPRGELSLFLLDLRPGSHEPLERPPRGGDRFLHLIQGEIEITIDQETHLLHQGDSVHFKASRRLQLRNAGLETARILWADWPRVTL